MLLTSEHTHADLLLCDVLLQFTTEDDLASILANCTIVSQEKVRMVTVKNWGVDLGAGDTVVGHNHLTETAAVFGKVYDTWERLGNNC